MDCVVGLSGIKLYCFFPIRVGTDRLFRLVEWYLVVLGGFFFIRVGTDAPWFISFQTVKTCLTLLRFLD